jgi:hypothetical protein
LSAVGKQRGLTLDNQPEQVALRGQIGKFTISITPASHNAQLMCFKLSSTQIPGSLTIGADSWARKLIPDVALGDEDFDREVRVFGDEPQVTALLDQHNRAALRDALRRDPHFKIDGQAIITVRTDVVDQDEILETIDLQVLASDFTPDGDTMVIQSVTSPALGTVSESAAGVLTNTAPLPSRSCV